MSVYRRPFDYATHRVARVEWQPQPSWQFDCVAAAWEWSDTQATDYLGLSTNAVPWEWHNTTGQITVTGDIAITCNAAAWEWTAPRWTIVASVELATTATPWEWAGGTATITASLLHITAAGMTVRTAQKSMFGRASQKSMVARASQKQMTARVA